MGDPLLRLVNVHAGYGEVDVLHDVNIEVAAGEFVSVVGPNGAGKSTLFKTVFGVTDLHAGGLWFDGVDLRDLPAWDRAALGIAHVPEGRQLFPSLTVRENVVLGLDSSRVPSERAHVEDVIYSLFPVLQERANQLAGTLSGGEQQMAAIARGLATSPKLLMLDEPSMGLAPALVDEVFERLITVREKTGVAILLVEQRVGEALLFANRGYVLEGGNIVLSGSGEVLRKHEGVRRAYLGL